MMEKFKERCRALGDYLHMYGEEAGCWHRNMAKYVDQIIKDEDYKALEKLEAAKAVVDKRKADNAYKEKRRKEYGPTASQLEEIYDDMEAWRLRIAAIKLKHPKNPN